MITTETKAPQLELNATHFSTRASSQRYARRGACLAIASLTRGISACACWLIDFVNENGLSAAYNVISETLHQASILALCRIWDQSEHVASLKALLDLIGSPEVFRFYEERGTVDHNLLNALKASYWKTFNTAEVQALMRMRHTRLAHTAPREGPSHKSRR